MVARAQQHPRWTGRAKRARALNSGEEVAEATDVERHRSGRGDAGPVCWSLRLVERRGERVPVPRPDCPRGLDLHTASGQRGRVRGLLDNEVRRSEPDSSAERPATAPESETRGISGSELVEEGHRCVRVQKWLRLRWADSRHGACGATRVVLRVCATRVRASLSSLALYARIAGRAGRRGHMRWRSSRGLGRGAGGVAEAGRDDGSASGFSQAGHFW